MKPETEAYLRGSDAFYEDVSLGDNPYDAGTEEAAAWEEGWQDADRDADDEGEDED
jgi:hypothetical protein